MTLLDTTVLPFGLAWDSPGMQMASLDHAMWFHRPFRADEWLLYDQRAISTSSARGLAGGAIFSRDGRLVVSVVQEGLARVWVGHEAQRRRRPPSLALVLLVACSGDDDADTDAGSTVAPPASTPTSSATDGRRGTRPTESAPAASGSAAPTATAAETSADPAVTVTEVAVAEAPVDLTWREGDPGLYVVEQGGRILRLADGELSTVLDATDLTDADGERGLLGLAFAPAGDLAYTNYTDLNGDTTIFEYPVEDDGTFLTGDNARSIFVIEQPYPNHNGGDLTFGPDGMLYIGMGDGGSGGDPERRATDLSTPLGKLLRIDPTPSSGEPYTVPADNPFVGRRQCRHADLVERSAQPVAVLLRPHHG